MGFFLFEFSKRAVCEIINITRKIRPNSYIELNLFAQDDQIFHIKNYLMRVTHEILLYGLNGLQMTFKLKRYSFEFLKGDFI